MSAWHRARARRRYTRLGFLAAALIAVGVYFPTVSASAEHAVMRHVVAEATGDTANVLATKVGREVAWSAVTPKRITVRPTGDGSCVAAPTQVKVDCAADVALTHGANDEFAVTVTRHGESFTWNSNSYR